MRNQFESGVTNPDCILDMNGKTTFDKAYENVVMIGGGVESQFIKGVSTIANITQADASIKAYMNLVSAANATITGIDNFAFESNDGWFTIKWNGQVVYEVELLYSLGAELLYSIDDATINLSGVEGITAAEVVGIMRDGVAVEFSANGDILTLTGDDVLNGEATAATGAKTEIVLLTKAAKYTLQLKVYTDVIDSVDEFSEINKFMVDTVSSNVATKTLKGYYILSQDLDFANYPDYDSPLSFNDISKDTNVLTVSSNFGFNGTFDGNGYQFKNLCVKGTGSTYDQSLFGVVGPDAIIKNIAFVNCSLASGLNRSAFFASTVYGKLENIYVDVTMPASTDSSKTNSAFVGRGLHTVGNGFDWQYVRGVKNVTVNVKGVMSDTSYVFRGQTAVISKATAFTNFVIIANGMPEAQLCYDTTTKTGYQTAKEVKALNTNFKICMTANDATALTAAGDVAISAKDRVLLITWKGQEVYKTACDVKLAYSGIVVKEDENGNESYVFASGIAQNKGIRVTGEMPDSGIIEYTLTYKKHSQNTYFELLFFVAGDSLGISGGKPTDKSLIRITFRPNNGDIYVGETNGPSTVGRIKPTDAVNAFAKLIENTADGADVEMNVKVVYAKGLFEFYINDVLYVAYGSDNTAIFDAATKGYASFNAIVDGLTGTGFGFSVYNTDPATMPDITINNIKVTANTSDAPSAEGTQE